MKQTVIWNKVIEKIWKEDMSDEYIKDIIEKYNFNLNSLNKKELYEEFVIPQMEKVYLDYSVQELELKVNRALEEIALLVTMELKRRKPKWITKDIKDGLKFHEKLWITALE